jgi:hypothetical protein
MQYVDMFHALQTGTDKNGQIVCCCDRLSYIECTQKRLNSNYFIPSALVCETISVHDVCSLI